MPNLFGTDIAGILANAVNQSGGLRTGSLTKKTTGTRTGGSLTGGTNPSDTTHSFQGFVEQKTVRRSGEVSTQNMSVMTFITNTINPVTVPAAADTAVMDGATYTLVELLKQDPAAATYEFAVET